ncbi:zinc dependent phospholipase C family protein [Aquibacillus saliphilus]|uniref:zinc dependent phospholipase C family protein n=1 Tax=Aquibacillus saliphilus TaxID=1909422 RepID=UPI001CF0BB03|nr:zinc dependent phospholipase C family protein [Aquibacillus saliphilus]
MPNIWTHILFCEELLDTIDAPASYKQQEAYLNLGAQGPDPFFYHNFWPWMKNKKVNNIGTLLHTKKCGDFLMNLITDAANGDDQTKAYVFGFITHHILDRNTHPYIHYRAGYSGNKHQKLEVIIDTLLMDQFRNLKTWKAPVYKEIDSGRKLHSSIHTLLHENISKQFPDALEGVPKNYILDSYKDMKLALRVLFDPYGWKNLLFAPLVSSFSHQPVKKDIDFLNNQQSTWYHPATNESKKSSFLQLYEAGRAEGIEIMSEVVSFLEKPSPQKKERLRILIGDISYDTGEPLEFNYMNLYCAPIV